MHSAAVSKVATHLILHKEDYSEFEQWKIDGSTRESSDYDYNTTLGEGTKRRIQRLLNSNSRASGDEAKGD
ncbi:hypothetical protein BHM03_00038157 [Ensete ventricosum]|nr:hypothetical protein BHM03_00038157 [Ensete ventricosum]